MTSTPSSALIDTHVLLWMLTDTRRLSATASRILSNRELMIYVSAASAWEIATKQRLGKLPQADVLMYGYHRHLERLDVEELAITSEHALLAGSMDWSHRDPFDRMIAAHCMSASLPLVSADRAFDSLASIQRIW